MARQRHGLDVRVVDVSALGEPDLVTEVVAEAFGCGGTSRLGHVDRVAAHLRDRRAVLVLDGFERLVGAAPDVAALAGRCAGLTVLTTSQRPLLVRGERRSGSYRCGLPMPSHCSRPAPPRCAPVSR